MKYAKLQAYLARKKGVTEEFPFGPEVAVFKVSGRIFAIVAWQKNPLEISLKCDPEDALALRAMYAGVRPGYHLNKTHWNTVTLDGTLVPAVVYRMIDQSYQLVVSSLTAQARRQLEQL